MNDESQIGYKPTNSTVLNWSDFVLNTPHCIRDSVFVHYKYIYLIQLYLSLRVVSLL